MKNSKSLLRKGKLMLPQAILLTTLFSCNKQNMMESYLQTENTIQVQQDGLSAILSNTNVIYEETFEGTKFLDSYVSLQTATTYSITQGTKPVFQGSRSGRFELRDSDPNASGGTRAEVLFPFQSSLNRWYSFAVYFPSATYQFDREDELISQWHQGGGTSGSMSLRTEKDRYQLALVPIYRGSVEKYDLGPIEKDRWNIFIIHANHSTGSEGLIEVWLNGKKMLNRTGRNMYSLTDLGISTPRWKFGIYKSEWNGTATSDTKQRVLYFDNVRLSSEKATYEEVAAAYGATTTTPEQSPTPTPTPTPEPPATTTPPATTSPITSFTLVNAGTEQDIITITNGVVINLAKVSDTRLNIRANGVSSGSVKFELSGKQSKTHTDQAAPYALHGDDGWGNYYYGNWNPPETGIYTLKATTSTGSSTSITFTFINDASAPLVSTTTPPSTTAPSPITSFTLVNAGTERDVMTIANGATIRLSQLSDTRLNIRANGVSSGSVKFELSGKQSKTYTDQAAPYALHGDNGYGDYYYGNWNPPETGIYTLKATPASGSPYTITFTITN